MSAELIGALAQNYNNSFPQSVGLSEVGIIVPMSLIMCFVSLIVSRKHNKYITVITKGIDQVASGEFNIKLDIKNSGPYKEVYQNFNKMTNELNSVQALKDDFTNKFSHEFKTPITSIKGFAELSLNSNILEEDRKIYLHIIANEANRLAQLSNNIMLLTTLESQEILIDKEQYDLEEQLKQCAIGLLPQLEAKHIELTVNLASVKIFANQDLMQHVWINLITNAIKFTPQDGNITIQSEIKNDEIVVSISDSGVGIDEQEVTKIFSEYYKGNSIGSENGLGLGLSIVKRVIDLTGGRIEVISSLGHGSTFKVFLLFAIQ